MVVMVVIMIMVMVYRIYYKIPCVRFYLVSFVKINLTDIMTNIRNNKYVMHHRQKSNLFFFFSFEWKVRDVDSKVITIEPRTGTILAGERQVGLHSALCILFYSTVIKLN